jgi:uncharacterized protein with PIN domain/mRNA deadenylase 3'-5' endonuclease subunit Ccr4
MGDEAKNTLHRTNVGPRTGIHAISDDNANNNNHTISVVSWNMLAEAYCSPRSHVNLPASYRKVVFDRTARRDRIFAILKRLAQQQQPVIDVLCLQEVDVHLDDALQRWGYAAGRQTPRTRAGGGSGGRVDACAVYVRDHRWQIVAHELVRLDDLATLRSAPHSVPDDRRIGNASNSASATSHLQGLQQGFLRRNAALLVRLRDTSGRTVVVANAHLYWNPGFEYVKMCQAHYILQRARAFLQHAEEPLIFCGDLNSRPHGAAHTYLTQGFINAKRIAPWYSYGKADESMTNDCETTDDGALYNEAKDDDEPVTHSVLEQTFSALDLNDTNNTSELASPRIRYVLDATLNKLCRWLRILGQDAALETDKEEKSRTQYNGTIPLFDRAREERRTLVTTSTRLMQRRDCPTGAYCLNPSVLPHLEVALVHLLLTHGVVLEPATFLSRCVVCNGKIVKVQEKSRQRQILEGYDAPVLAEEMVVYECDGCQQGYWWCDLPTSSASRVKTQATRLFQVCLQAGVPIDGRVPDLFAHVNVPQEQEQGWDYTQPGSDLLRQRLDVIDWLKDESLSCPFHLESAYAMRDESNNLVGEEIPFTNVTDSFVNTLDYIFFEPKRMELLSRLYVPKSFRELNTKNIPRGHLLPSDIWPSDHLAIGATFALLPRTASTDPSVSLAERTDSAATLQKDHRGVAPLEPASARVTSGSDIDSEYCLPTGAGVGALPIRPTAPVFPRRHKKRCDCGCVPSILSMFEMAELRKQARLAKAQRTESGLNSVVS